jgi:hypothetical protein
MGHGREDDDGEDPAQTFPELGLGAESGAELTEEVPGVLNDLIDGEGQKHEQGEDGGEIFGAVPIVVLEMVALIFEGVEGFVLDLPAGATGARDLFNRGFGEREIGHPRPDGLFPRTVGPFAAQEIDRHVNRAIVQTESAGPGMRVSEVLCKWRYDIGSGTRSS